MSREKAGGPGDVSSPGRNGEEVRSGAVNTALVRYSDPVADGERYLTATEWLNGEGYDFSYGSGGQSVSFAMTHADLDALRTALGRLEAMPPPGRAAAPARTAGRRAGRLIDL